MQQRHTCSSSSSVLNIDCISVHVLLRSSRWTQIIHWPTFPEVILHPTMSHHHLPANSNEMTFYYTLVQSCKWYRNMMTDTRSLGRAARPAGRATIDWPIWKPTCTVLSSRINQCALSDGSSFQCQTILTVLLLQ